jgi:hypothetical protein
MQQVYDKEKKGDLSPEQLREAEQGSHDKVGPSPDEQAQIDQLEASSKSGETAKEPEQDSDKVGKGYTGEGVPKHEKKGRVLSFSKKKKRGLIFGGVLGISAVGGFTLFSTTLAPLQFIHISEVLSTQFSTQQDQDDESVVRLYRYIRHLTRGTPERTRLSILKNRFADRFEVRLQASGLTSTYTNIYGFIDGYAIDRSHPEFRNMDDRQITQYMKETYNLDVVAGETLTSSPEAEHKLVIKATNLSYYSKARKFIRTRMVQAGASKVASVIGMRLLVVRSGAGFHPMTLKGIDNKILRSFEDLLNKMRQRYLARVQNGTDVVPGTNSRQGGETDAERAASQNAEATRANADQVLQDGKQASTAIKDGTPRPFSTFQTSLSAKIALGGAAAASIPCLLRGIANDSGEIKKAQVLFPGERIGTEFLSLGSQVETNIDYQGEQLEFYDRKLSGIDSRNQKSTFSDAAGWNALQSTRTPVKGVPPSKTLRNVGSGTPFDFLNEGGTGATLDVVCSAPVQAGLMVITFLGGPVSAVAGIAAGIAASPLLHEAAQWLSGNALDVAAVGADLGNVMTFGSAWAAYEQGLASGGHALKPEEAQTLKNISTSSMREDFESKSLAYRLFNPQDYRTPVAKLIDQQNTQSMGQNLASAFRGLTHVGSGLVENFSSIFFAKTHAQTVPYDWGVPTVAFSRAQMNDPRFKNPYVAAEAAASLFESPAGQGYIDKAAKCNSVTISKDTEGHWNATSVTNSTPVLKTVPSAECATETPDWTLVQFFIRYTVNMNSEACRVGDAESCADVGFTGGGAPTQ